MRVEITIASGCTVYGTTCWMASLRRLKQMASVYHPEVWKKPHGRRILRAIERGPNGVWIYKD